MESSPCSPGSLLREARTRANLSQTDVARRAHVAQSVVSAYESGRREPAFGTLERLIAATGHRLDVRLEPAPGTRPGLPDTPLGRRLRQRRRQVLATAEKYGASNLRVFGSVARGQDSPESDVDILVDLSPRSSLVTLGRLERELSGLLGVRVDVVPADGLRPAVRRGRARSSSIVSRHDQEWLADIIDAIQAIRNYQERGDLSDGLIFDAVRLRLIEIGEAVKRLSAELLVSEPNLPWEEIAGIRDRLAHRYFDTSHAIVQATVDNDIPELDLVARRLLSTDAT